MVQSVRDLNQKRKMLNKIFDSLMHEKSNQWLKDSKQISDPKVSDGIVKQQAFTLNSIHDYGKDNASTKKQDENPGRTLNTNISNVSLDENGIVEIKNIHFARSKSFLKKGARHTYDAVASI